jgi:hypothetical protein
MWSGGIPREASDGPQIARGTEWHWMARWNDYEQRDDTDIPGRDPVGPLAPLGGAEPLLHSPPPKWERPRSQSQNLLRNRPLDLLSNPLSNPLLNVLLLVSVDFQLS